MADEGNAGGASEYDVVQPEPVRKPKPGDPDWVEPTPVILKPDPVVEEEMPVDPDVQRHKAVAILGYLVFLVPLVAAPHSKFARFHANQGLLLFITWCVSLFGVVVLTVGWGIASPHLESIKLLQFFFGCICYLVPIALIVFPLVLTFMGIVHAANGETKDLPLIGHWKLIKPE